MNVTTLYDLKQRYFDNSKDKLLEELPELIKDEAICRLRSQEINILVELDQYHDGAKIMLDMRNMFELPGDFSDLEKVVQAVSEGLTSHNRSAVKGSSFVLLLKSIEFSISHASALRGDTPEHTLPKEVLRIYLGEES